MNTRMKDPSRSEVWLVNLNPTKGHEQRGRRPCLVVSANPFNEGPAGLAVVLPITTTDRGIPWHVQVDPPEGGLDRPSFIMCEQPRTIDERRLMSDFGAVGSDTMQQVEQRLRDLLLL